METNTKMDDEYFRMKCVELFNQKDQNYNALWARVMKDMLFGQGLTIDHNNGFRTVIFHPNYKKNKYWSLSIDANAILTYDLEPTGSVIIFSQFRKDKNSEIAYTSKFVNEDISVLMKLKVDAMCSEQKLQELVDHCTKFDVGENNE